MIHGQAWHLCRRWSRLGFRCPFGRVGPRPHITDIQTQPERRGEDDRRDDDDDDGFPILGAPERRRKGRVRDMESMVNEVLDAMSTEALRQFDAKKRPKLPVPVLIMRAMVEAMDALAGQKPSAGAVEEALAAFAAERVRAVARQSRRFEQVPWWRGIDFSKGPAQAVALGAGVAGGGFLINWARKIRTTPLFAPLLGASGAGGFGSGGQG